MKKRLNLNISADPQIPPLAKGGRGDLSEPNLGLTHDLYKKPTPISLNKGDQGDVFITIFIFFNDYIINKLTAKQVISLFYLKYGNQVTKRS